MRKLLSALVLAGTATTAAAGGYVAPVVEAAPVVVQKSSSSSGIWVPIAILVLVGVLASGHHDKGE
ncbi:MAG: hypothetical protein CVT82_03840 [Alphaproteobacteria bacterium HGW-Alphaproteobacteria-4]|jgi:hypothetical protein|nr:MAG: hypothetical protein CVT82_03840 [Alphaproteobacteria bacterium HGW-Alphaproteobacteria-4]